jgi:hypothetical protein
MHDGAVPSVLGAAFPKILGNVTKGQMVQATLAGTAKTYAAIALQSDAFAKNTLIKNPVFSNLTVDDKTGLVGFKLVFTVAPGDLSYEKFITDSTKSATTAPLVQPTT